MPRPFRALLVIALFTAAAVLAPPTRAQIPAGTEVDLQLILAADVSGSMDEDEAALQRRGYLQALSDPRVVRAIQSGGKGRIAVLYLEWAGPHWQKVVANWT